MLARVNEAKSVTHSHGELMVPKYHELLIRTVENSRSALTRIYVWKFRHWRGSTASPVQRRGQVIFATGGVRVDVGFSYEYIDAKELAARLNLPESWVYDHTRSRTSDRIPTVRFGKYVRFAWGSPELAQWMKRHFDHS